MFDKNTTAVLEFILQMIEEIEIVVDRHGSAYNAILDVEGKNSILMNLLQIGEKLNRIESKELRDILPIEEAYSVRNRITHDYGGIDPEIIENIVDAELPVLKLTISDLLK